MTNVEAAKPAKQKSQKIRVDFKRTSFWIRFKLKYCSTSFWARVVFVIFRLVLLLGISYVILFPFFAKITRSFFSMADFTDKKVQLIPRFPTLDSYKMILFDNHYFEALFNTLILAAVCALLQTFICSVIGYGFAKFKFRGSKLAFALVLFTMIVPHQTLRLAMPTHFKSIDFFGLVQLFGRESILNTNIPLILLSITGLGFKNALYIFMMRQFYRGVPDELEESAYIDGYGVFKTFLYIIIPLSIPMMITIFLLSFSWQWTDGFYTTIFFPSRIESMKTYLMPDVIDVSNLMKSLGSLQGGIEGDVQTALANTAGLLVILPLIVMYLFCQRYLIQGIERSGLVG